LNREIVSPRIIIASARTTTTSNVKMIAALAVSIRLSPAKKATRPKTVKINGYN
jgi:hypothetical protein